MNKKIDRLQYLTQELTGFTPEELTEAVCNGGIQWVQLRLKNTEFRDFLETAYATKKICDFYGARLIIDDQIEVARQVGASGVHLGKKDRHPREARKLLGDKAIIGGTANTFQDIKRLHDEGFVDYIGLGPFSFTTTKDELSPVLGETGIRSIMDQYKAQYDKILPVVAIGGINLDDIKTVMKTGVYGIAVSSGINMAREIGEMARSYVKEVNKMAENNI